ncbi:hypothetical protein EJ03DRAFT_318383 [Teratosphaeria nubilosa]|uniref:Transcription factor Iwr1 domain-containing protein n=1 Tax=Teratosphaeria nubilosa TaxID=161662 RepID=A0A6G1L063_9PEZI|nr:hypothetical protein EJ03DRAFT_318383 [Teratosphaeria nubilosa]
MSGPATICLKRKAGEDPPEHLLVQKRQISEVVGEEIRYTLKRKEKELLNSTPNAGAIGYLIISEDDESVWEKFMEAAESEGAFETDDEDENAEDWYGADYPEDEMAQDDEFGRGAYGYREGGGSDCESWDGKEEEGVWSDGEEEGGLEREMRAWRGRAAGIGRV